MKREKAFDIVFILICVFIALFLGIGIYTLPHKDFSEEENRILATQPKISVKSVISGDFFKQLNTFYSDRIPLRSFMIQTKARCELLLGKRENDQVIYLPDGRLVQRGIYVDYTPLMQNISAVERLKEEQRAVLALIPRSVDVYVGGEESRRVCDMAGEIPLLEALCELGEKSYYKTDHHLDAEGTFAVYRYVMQELGETPLSQEDFEMTKVCNGFLGSTYSKGGLVSSVSDTISAWRYSGDDDITVECLDVGCDLNSLYAPDALESKDKYRYFLGGNHGVLTVRQADGEERQQLFIIKDSFANAVIPLLARHFDLTVYDPRYSPLPPETDPTDTRTVVICGVDTLATTKGFIKNKVKN